MRKASVIAALLLCALCASCSVPVAGEPSVQPSASAAGETGTLGLGAAHPNSSPTDAPQSDPDFAGMQADLKNSNGTDASYTKCTDLPPETMGGVEFKIKTTRVGEYEYQMQATITEQQYENVISYLKSTYGEPTIVDDFQGNPYLIWANEEASCGARGMFLMRVYRMTLDADEDLYSMGLNIRKP